MQTYVYSSYAGGMFNTSTNHRLTPQDCCPLIVNGTVKSGFIAPRPSFTKSGVTWLGESFNTFDSAVFQGAFAYSSTEGDILLLAMDGHIFGYHIDTKEMRIIRRKAFSKRSKFVYFVQRGNYAIAQDGVSPPVIIQGFGAKQGTASTSVPCGTVMADGWGRLAVASPSRRRIYFSNHEADPTAKDVLTFTEGSSYFKNARYFEVSPSNGPIVGMAFAPGFYGKNLGPLMVFQAGATRAYDVSIPREDWATNQIDSTPLPSHGACSHSSIVRRGNDLIFSDQYGRIQTAKAAMRRDEDARMKGIDDPVWQFYRGEDETLKAWRYSAKFDGRVLSTVWPRRIKRPDGRWSVVHSALAVHLEEPSITEREHVWDGMWTGLGFASLTIFNNANRCFVVATDANGRNSIHELTKSNCGHDDGHPIEVMAGLRDVDFDSPMLPKKLTGAAMKLSNLVGKVTTAGYVSTESQTPVPWFRDSRNSEYATCNAAANPRTEPRIDLSSIPDPQKFTAISPIFAISGHFELREVSIETETLKAPNTVSTKCDGTTMAPITTNCFNPLRYVIPSRA